MHKETALSLQQGRTEVGGEKLTECWEKESREAMEQPLETDESC